MLMYVTEVTISRNKRLKPSESSFDLAQLHCESTVPSLLLTVAMEDVTYMFNMMSSLCCSLLAQENLAVLY